MTKYLFCFIYLSLERGEARKKERARNIDVWEIKQLIASHLPQLGSWPATQECALTGNRTGDLSVHRLVLNPLSHTSQDQNMFNIIIFLLKKYICIRLYTFTWVFSTFTKCLLQASYEVNGSEHEICLSSWSWQASYGQQKLNQWPQLCSMLPHMKHFRVGRCELGR